MIPNQVTEYAEASTVSWPLFLAGYHKPLGQRGGLMACANRQSQKNQATGMFREGEDGKTT